MIHLKNVKLMNVIFCTGTSKEMIDTHEIHNINDVSLFSKK